MSLTMTKDEREQFLAGTHVAVISVVERPDRAPLTVPVWYRYEPGGEVRFITGGNSRKALAIQKAGRISLCVQTETPPYQYVTVEGPVVLGGMIDEEQDVRAIAIRYLGAQLGEAYLAMNVAAQAESVLVQMRPERWLSVDYSKVEGL